MPVGHGGPRKPGPTVRRPSSVRCAAAVTQWAGFHDQFVETRDNTWLLDAHRKFERQRGDRRAANERVAAAERARGGQRPARAAIGNVAIGRASVIESPSLTSAARHRGGGCREGLLAHDMCGGKRRRLLRELSDQPAGAAAARRGRCRPQPSFRLRCGRDRRPPMTWTAAHHFHTERCALPRRPGSRRVRAWPIRRVSRRAVADRGSASAGCCSSR